MEKIKKGILIFELFLLVIGIFYSLKEVQFPNYDFVQKKKEVVLPLDKNNSIEQTFSNSPSKVSAIEFFPVVIDPNAFDNFPFTVYIKVNNEIQSTQILYLEKFGVRQEKVKIKIPRSISENKFSIEIHSTAPPNSLGVWGSSIDSYINGQFFLNGDPFLTDISFVTYDGLNFSSLKIRFNDLMDSMFDWFQVLIIIGFLYFIFNILLTTITKEKRIQKNGFSLFLVVAIVPLLMYFCGLIQKVFNIPLKVVIYSVLTIILIFDLVFLFRNRKIINKNLRAFSYKNIFIGLILVLIFCVFGSFQNTYIQVMPWKDGLYHQQLIQNMVSDQEIPLFYPYHIGFHLISLLIYQFHNDPQTILISGQMIYILFFISNYLLGKKILRSNIYGLLSAILITFFSPLGSLLLSWGRYPLLLGFSMLNSFFLVLYDEEIEKKRRIVYAGIIFLGLILIHWKITILAILLLISYEISKNNEKIKNSDSDKSVFYLLILIFIALGYELVSLFSNSGLSKLFVNLVMYGEPFTSSELIMMSFEKGGILIWIFGLIGLIHSGFKNKSKPDQIHTWLAITLVISFIDLIYLPISMIGKYNFLLLLQIILCYFSAYEIRNVSTSFISFFKQKDYKLYKQSICSFIILIGILGMVINLQPVHSINILCGENDLKAFQWIKTNIPENTNFLISSEDWNGKQFPTDGGGWLSIFTPNQVIYSGLLADNENYCEYLENNEIGYVYIGSGNTPRIQYQAIENGDLYPVYYSNGIAIYRVSCK